MKSNIIHIVGASGAGTTTLGLALECEYGYKWLDTDDYFWQPTDPPFMKSRTREERTVLLSADLAKYSKCVISGSLCGWGDAFIPRFDLVVFIDTSTDVRIERLKKREYKRYGDRIRKGGDMYKEHTKFIEWAKTYDTNKPPERCRKLHEEWFGLLPCPLLRVDGTRPVDELLEQINLFTSLNEETDKERQARIYPIILSEYNTAWAGWFNDERMYLERLIGKESIARISHFGSTSVPGLVAKPTVDILLEIKEDTNVNKLIDALSPPEYICLNPPDMPTPPPHLVFLKGYMPTGFAEKVYHIHVRYLGDWDELHFRDYLIAHPETAAEYAAQKRRLFNEFEHNRDGYTNAKGEFIRAVMEKARKEKQ